MESSPNRIPLIITVVAAVFLIVCVAASAGGILFMQSNTHAAELTQVADEQQIAQKAAQKAEDDRVQSLQATLEAQAQTLDEQAAALKADEEIFAQQTADAESAAPAPSGGGSETPVNYIAVLDGKVTGVRFYQCDEGIVDLDKRKYTDTFDSATVKYICFELNIAYPEAKEKIPFTIEAEWLDADGNRINKLPTESFVDKGWTSSFTTDGLGAKEGGIFKPGVNTLKLYVDDVLITVSKFTVK